MNEEEKKAIAFLRFYVSDDEDEYFSRDYCIDKNIIETILNLIDKQQQEIEELKDFNVKLQATKDRLDSYDKENTLEIEKLKKEIEKLKSKKYILNAETNEIKEIPISDDYISKDKIKAKAQELDNQQRQWREDRTNKHTDAQIIYARDVLEELISETNE